MSRADIPQLVTPADCRACRVCCRFSGPASDMAPVFSPGEFRAVCAAGLDPGAFSGADSPVGERVLPRVDAQGACCPAFHRPVNACRFYEARPLDCRLYPLVLMYDDDGAGVLLAADIACPVVERLARDPRLAESVRQAARLLESSLADHVAECRAVIGEHKPWMAHVTPLPGLTRRLCRSDLGLRRLTLSARDRLQPYFEDRPGPLAAHAFVPIRVWAGLFDLYYAVERERLLVVAAGNGPAFLIVPPLGPGPLGPALDRAVEIQRALNAPHVPPRVQEVDDGLWPALERRGFRITQTSREYVCDRADLALLSGRAYKGKRSARNHFVKHHEAAFRPFREEDLPACFALYRSWWEERASADDSTLFTSQLQAGASMFLQALREHEALGLRVRVVEAEGAVVACTAGFEAPGGRQFAVLIEIADRRVKGAAAWCFQQFCREVEPFPLINAMTDSGLAGLAAAKELYHPAQRPTSRVVELRGAQPTPEHVRLDPLPPPT